ncbi:MULTISPECIES: SDR family oxidoreductase [Nitrincola]|uniref:Ribitol 2-dehydrogenase n=1 Tax=Nitrincola nitratireducens TaxID=1229521 RepID=W9V9Q2_9GAMM|nr:MULTISPECIES: SDR family oxidoreductase [Nitrincola]EXJ12792.1 Ribitol 2-dehydrogenase [Nitrincola nitratireducens]
MKKSILITGCSTGIGLYCALKLNASGYQVIATARKEEDVQALQAQGLESFVLDLASSESIHAGVERTLALTNGRLDALFNNGAYGQPGAVEDLSRDVLRAQFETNLFGWVELTNAIIPIMRQQKQGRIVMNSSVLGLVAMKYRGAYNASKFALEGITDTYRLELSGSGIGVSLIEPGPIVSDFRKNALRAFQANIDIESSVHTKVYKSVLSRLASTDEDSTPFTLTPEAVYHVLLHALESERPRPRYYVTKATYLLGYLKRILPTRWMDTVLKEASKKENR